MLMIGTGELAKRLYEVWRRSVCRGKERCKHADWERLSKYQQGIWRAVAEEAGRVMTDAMGAA